MERQFGVVKLKTGTMLPGNGRLHWPDSDKGLPAERAMTGGDSMQRRPLPEIHMERMQMRMDQMRQHV